MANSNLNAHGMGKSLLITTMSDRINFLAKLGKYNSLGKPQIGSNVQVYAVINLIALRFLFKIINLSNGNLLMISMEGAGKPNAQIQVPVCVMRINGT